MASPDGSTPCFVYILQCADGSLYTGTTHDLASRMARHNAGTSPFTSGRRPVTLLYSEEFSNRADATKRERQIKHWSRLKKLALVAGNLDLLRTASRCRRP